MGQHALLSPSSAHKWLNCTASALLEAKEPNKNTSFTEEGTLAHAYCAKKLKGMLGQSTRKEQAEIDALSGYHTGEMDEATDLYRDIVAQKFEEAKKRSKDAILMIEQILDFSHYVPNSFGTADAVIIADGTMEVIDFKYGKGVKVEAYQNPQMMMYAVGAWDLYNLDYEIESVRMTIVQPRLYNTSTFELSVGALSAWALETLIPRAKHALNGGAQKVGTWCRFCRVKPTCRAIAEVALKELTDYAKPDTLTNDELAEEILPKIAIFKNWISSIEEYALSKALEGNKFNGFKLVEGRSIRKIMQPEKLKEVLNENGYTAGQYLKPEELKSLTELEKLVGKKHFAELAKGMIDKPKGKPTLAPSDDPRKEWTDEDNDLNDFINS